MNAFIIYPHSPTPHTQYSSLSTRHFHFWEISNWITSASHLFLFWNIRKNMSIFRLKKNRHKNYECQSRNIVHSLGNLTVRSRCHHNHRATAIVNWLSERLMQNSELTKKRVFGQPYNITHTIKRRSQSTNILIPCIIRNFNGCHPQTFPPAAYQNSSRNHNNQQSLPQTF